MIVQKLRRHTDCLLTFTHSHVLAARTVGVVRWLCRQKDQSKQTDGSPLALFNMFVQRCRDQLHLVLAMSPIGDAFRSRLRKFPSLINCCTIDWFQVSTAFLLSYRTSRLLIKSSASTPKNFLKCSFEDIKTQTNL